MPPGCRTAPTRAGAPDGSRGRGESRRPGRRSGDRIDTMAVMPSSSAESAVPRPRSTARWVLLLGALATLPALTVDMYLPLLPEVGAELGAPDSLAQLTLSGMLVGGAVGQLVIGPLSDRYGRRLPVLVGLTL